VPPGKLGFKLRDALVPPSHGVPPRVGLIASIKK
jgi:hypothetical protein